MTCARCGASDSGLSALGPTVDYEYCDDCNELFKDIHANGVTVRSRHTNDAFDQVPYVVGIADHSGPHTANIHDSNRPMNQVEALAMGKDAMEKYDLPGVFIYQKTGSVWLIDEYLDAHPGIAEDVRRERMSFLQKIRKSLF